MLTSVVFDAAEGPGKMTCLEVAWNRRMTDDKDCKHKEGRQVRSNVGVRESSVRFAAIGVSRAPLV